MYLLVAEQLTIMTLIAAVSFVFSKKHKYGEPESRYLSNLLLFVISPCLILNTFNIPYDLEKIKSFGFSMAVSFVVLLFMVVIAAVFIHSKTAIGKTRDSLDKMSFVYSNAGFIGIPLINGILGSHGTFFLMGYIVMFNLFLWTNGVYTISHKIGIRQIFFNPNIIAILLGFLLFAMPFQLPSILNQTIKFFGDLNTAVSMIILGILFANFKKPVKGEKTPFFRVARVVVFRLIIIPVLLLILLKLTINFFDFSDLQKEIILIVFIAASCPVGMTIASFSVLYGKEESYSSLLVSVSSAVCVATLPIMVKLSELIL
ncbi:AEC family transporter [Treponema parvum]|uniref:AEC family transporter n=1 Tax=Treponema parvum TaxID=138851 RepID=A0A975IC77_9SPIR|nr:AEC family transporter [Treponema parvum]QTQ10769.1 AEC family transporter [Treponema parvum]